MVLNDYLIQTFDMINNISNPHKDFSLSSYKLYNNLK